MQDHPAVSVLEEQIGVQDVRIQTFREAESDWLSNGRWRNIRQVFFLVFSSRRELFSSKGHPVVLFGIRHPSGNLMLRSLSLSKEKEEESKPEPCDSFQQHLLKCFSGRTPFELALHDLLCFRKTVLQIAWVPNARWMIVPVEINHLPAVDTNDMDNSWEAIPTVFSHEMVATERRFDTSTKQILCALLRQPEWNTFLRASMRRSNFVPSRFSLLCRNATLPH